MSYDFRPYPKIPRLEKVFRYGITEKLDGTNGIVHIVQVGPYAPDVTLALQAGAVAVVGNVAVFAGSRSRWLKPGKATDNYGFAQWVKDNADYLVTLLEPGTHYGEWWGAGIQRRYAEPVKRFTLFNPWRYPHLPTQGRGPCLPGEEPSLLTTVPVLAQGSSPATLSQDIERASLLLLESGSMASPGYMNPEGLVVTIGSQNFKVILNEGDKALSRDGA